MTRDRFVRPQEGDQCLSIEPRNLINLFDVSLMLLRAVKPNVAL